MQHHVHIELVGGPEDGRTFVLPTAPSGADEPQAALPFTTFTLPGPVPDEGCPTVRYDLGDCRPDGVWRYDFVGEQLAARSER